MKTLERANGTSLASLARPMWRLLQRYQVDADQVLRDAGLDPRLMDQPQGRYPVRQMVTAWKKASALAQSPLLGLEVGRLVQPTDLHALGYAFLASSTLRTAFGRVTRFHEVVNDSIRFKLEETGELSTLTYHTELPELMTTASIEDARWAAILSRTAYVEPLNPVHIKLFHPESGPTGDYYGFFRCPISFDTGTSEMAFSRSDMDCRLPASNRDLARANDQILSRLLARAPKNDLIGSVRSAIVDLLPSGAPRDDAVAAALHLSARTLQRRLSAEGTNFSHQLDAVRRDLAEQYIADCSLSLSEISYLLGFADLSTFSRAFKRWTGQAPSAARATASA